METTAQSEARKRKPAEPRRRSASKGDPFHDEAAWSVRQPLFLQARIGREGGGLPEPATNGGLLSLLASGELRTKLAVEGREDSAEREADDLSKAAIGGKCSCTADDPQCPACRAAAQDVVHRKPQSGHGPASVGRLNLGAAHSLAPLDQSFFESRYNADLSEVRLHDNTEAAVSAAHLNARAFALGSDIAFARGEYRPDSTDGRLLLAHELAHVVQGHGGVRRQKATTNSATPAAESGETDPLTAPLTESEWRGVEGWLARGWVSPDPLTGDADHNATIIAEAIACTRAGFNNPHLCMPGAISDPRVQELKRQVMARGPIINWVAVPEVDRLGYAMEVLITHYGYSENAAAGIVGNLFAESGVLPSRVEGSSMAEPLKAQDAAGKTRTFSPEQVMNRSRTTGPKLPGVGLAQWTSPDRRAGLFQYAPLGRQLGTAILFDMDAQLDYLAHELQSGFSGLDKSLRQGGISANEASDAFLRQFERPADIPGQLRTRRNLAQRALDAWHAYRQAQQKKVIQSIKSTM